MSNPNVPRPSVIARCEHCAGEAAERDGDVLRCACGSLLARYVGTSIELKCRRCKRTLIVPVGSGAHAG